MIKEIMCFIVEKVFTESNELTLAGKEYIGLYDHSGRFTYTEVLTQIDQEKIIKDLEHASINVEGVLNADEVKRKLICNDISHERYRGL